MFFIDGLKKRSIRKQLDNLLSKSNTQAIVNGIESIGVVLNVEEETNTELFKNLAKDLNVHSNNLKIIFFSEDLKKGTVNFWDECYSPKDFGWKGKVLNPVLDTFLQTEFDVLISYYEKDIVELKLITAYSKAKVKTGILQTDERVNDLIIKTNIKAFKVFKQELIKYLKILS